MSTYRRKNRCCCSYCCSDPCCCPIQGPQGFPGPPGPPGTFSPAYGNFFNNGSLIEVPTGTAFPFNIQGPIAGGVSLLDPTTISIQNGGDYKINFVITDNTVIFQANPAAFPHFPTVGLFLNNVQVQLEQTNFGLEISQIEGQGCKPIVGDTILSIPNNSILQLRNITTIGSITSITTCDTVGNNIQFSIFKLN